ncbi:Glutathione transferase [Bertholletia excelsa]
MEKQSEEVVFGTWASAYCTRVTLALKLKGIPYQYVEEDLTNKSELLIQYNPVHKKVPVLVHEGKPIAESLVILEYIDEFWINSPKLLPEDPYKRAKVRFWANFYDQKWQFWMTDRASYITHHKVQGERERERAMADCEELIKVFEEGLERDFQGKSPFFEGENISYLGIVVGSGACNYQAFNEAVAVIIDAEKHPAFVSWVEDLKAHPLMKEMLPSHDKLVAKIRHKFSLSPEPKA